MKTLEKNDIKAKLTEMAEMSEKLKNLQNQLEVDYFGEDSETIDDLELDERVNNFYDFINSDFELHSLLEQIRLNLDALV
jgi:hypothetical protein